MIRVPLHNFTKFNRQATRDLEARTVGRASDQVHLVRLLQSIFMSKLTAFQNTPKLVELYNICKAELYKWTCLPMMENS
jgi:hypothetical protein